MPKPKEKIQKRIEAAIRAVLPKATPIRSNPSNGSAVKLKIAGKNIIAVWAGEGWLRQIQMLLKDSGARPDIIVARQMSPGAREAVAAKRIGWVDELGAAEIAIGTIVVSRSGRKPIVREKPPHWTPSVVAVAETILCSNGAWTIEKMKKATALSTGSCINALRVLTNLGFLVANAQRGPSSERKVTDREQLLDAYAEAAMTLPTSNVCSVGITWQDPLKGLEAMSKKWDKAGVEWATTGTAASAVMAPILTNVATVDVYVDAKSRAELDAVALKMGLPIIEGGRLNLKPFPSVTTKLLVTTASGINVAPWPRVYVDLRQVGVRGEEAAEHLREVMLG